MSPQAVKTSTVPLHLVDNSSYAPIKGHYFIAPPRDISACHDELKLCRIDVVNCIVGHRNKNAELSALRKINGIQGKDN